MQEVSYAGFWVRVGASLIDTALLLAVIVPALIGIYGWEYFEPAKSGLIAGPADVLLNWVAPAIAIVAFWIYRQATPGKAVLSLKIVDATSGAPPTAGQCVGRYLGYFVSTIPLLLGLIWVGFDRRKQGWHDKLANTVVIRVPREKVNGLP